MFLNEEKKPFKDLTGDEMKMIVDSIIDGSAEYFNQTWELKPCEDVYLNEIYRVPPRKTKIDWSCFDKKWRYFAIADNEEFLLFTDRPLLANYGKGNFWESDGYVYFVANLLSEKIIQIGDEPWQESLIERTEGE